MPADTEEAHGRVVPFRPILAVLVRIGPLELKRSLEREAGPQGYVTLLPTAMQEP